jgi:hypothetical protein
MLRHGGAGKRGATGFPFNLGGFRAGTGPADAGIVIETQNCAFRRDGHPLSPSLVSDASAAVELAAGAGPSLAVQNPRRGRIIRVIAALHDARWR